MIHDFEDFCTYVFVIVDDILQGVLAENSYPPRISP